MRPSSILRELARDLRLARRQLRRAPGHALVATLVLALGIGASTAIFSIVDGVLLRPLPYPNAERLHLLFEAGPEGAQRLPSYPTFEDWREEARGFDGLAYARGDDFTVHGPDGPQRVVAAFVSDGYFATLATPALHGRTFAGGRDEREPVAVLSHDYWQRTYAGDPAVVGRTISTPEGAFTIVGVMPRGFRAPEWADVWVPLGALPAEARYALERRDLHVDSRVYGRLAPGTTAAAGATALSRVAAALAAAHPAEQEGWTRAELTPMREALLGDVRAQLLVLSGAVALVLLVACVNVASLQVARASSRTRELAVRAALGAGRWRLARQLLAESLLLAAAGGALGVLLAWVGVRELAAALPDVMPRFGEVRVDARVALVGVAVSALAVVLGGLLPAWRAASPDLVGSLKAGTAGAGDGRATVRLRGALVVAQLALAVVLVIGASLLLDTLRRLQEVPLGFEPRRVLAVRVFPPAERFARPAAALALYERLAAAAARLPGVEHAAVANHLPLMGGLMPTEVETGHPPAGDEPPLAVHRTVSPGYFATLGVPVLRGRALEPRDAAAPGSGVVVNETLARRFYPDGDALGRSIRIQHRAQGRERFGEPIAATVVGVVADERYFGAEQDAPAQVYLPVSWDVWQHIVVAVRTSGDPQALAPALRRALLAEEPSLPIAGTATQTQPQPLTAYMALGLRERRLNASLLGGFALATLLLSAIGTAGVVAYVVAQRRREFGVRMAVGAQPADIVRLVAVQAARLVLAGVALGVLGALAATRVLASQLVGVSATDPLHFATVSLATALAVLAASLLPARRATRVGPTEALRAD